MQTLDRGLGFVQPERYPMKNEHQANLALHSAYMARGWKTGSTFTRPGQGHYVPTLQTRPGFLGALLRFLGM